MLGLDVDTLADLKDADEKCGYAALREKYLQFPPPGHQPAKVYKAGKNINCALFDLAYEALLQKNPCFNIYSINEQCPLLWDVLGFPTALTYLPSGATIYFDRTDVKKAIHAPESVDWSICGEHEVFVSKAPGTEPGYHDPAPDPIQHVLPQVIEATNRVLVSNGDLDMVRFQHLEPFLRHRRLRDHS